MILLYSCPDSGSTKELLKKLKNSLNYVQKDHKMKRRMRVTNVMKREVGVT